VADAPNQGRPIPRNNAVEQKEAAAFWWQQAGGEAASHRKPTQAHSKDQLHHHRDPERGKCIGAQAVEPPAEINGTLRPGNTAEPNTQANNRCGDQGDHAQFEACGQGVPDDLAHRFLVEQSLAKISMDQTVEITQILIKE
jgi:hypothetical protein